MAPEGFRQGRKKPRKQQFVGAELAAYSLCQQTPDLSGRKKIHGMAVDCAEPNDPMDRDDAIAVEYRDDPVQGRLTVLHVTIADVASVVPRASERELDRKLGMLDEAARAKAQTTYFAHGSRPMFPQRLQDRMSLENHVERPGVTISITFDDRCRRIHTELSRTRIKTQCKTYLQASGEMKAAGGSNAMQRVGLLAKNLLKRREGTVVLPCYDEKTGMYIGAEGHARHISSEASSSYVAVQGCMVAANEALAELMGSSNFLFRNQGNNGTGAEYGEECKGHFMLKLPKYAHITSPIRRYADVVNQRMMHWAIDVVEAVEKAAGQELRGRDAASQKERLHGQLWEAAESLLGRATEFKEAGRNRRKIVAGRQLEGVIGKILLPLMGEHAAGMAAQDALKTIDAMELPYTRKEMAAVARVINEKTRKSLTAEQADALMNATLDTIFLPSFEPDADGYVSRPEHKEEAVRRRRPSKFAELLEAAARRGDNNDFFASEVLRRLHSDENKLELVRNLHTLLVVADKEKDSRWAMLRREAFRMLKEDSILAERVFAYMQGQSKPSKAFMLETSLLDSGGISVPSALVMYHHEGLDYSAPMVDTGDTPEKARAGAILTFFRHYGHLSAHEDLYTPKLIELALGRTRVQKGERLGFLKKICGKAFEVEEVVMPVAHQEHKVNVVLKLTQKATGEMLEKSREGWGDFAGEYLDKCAKDMIEDRRFVDMLSHTDLPVTLEHGESSRVHRLFAKQAGARR